MAARKAAIFLVPVFPVLSPLIYLLSRAVRNWPRIERVSNICIALCVRVLVLIAWLRTLCAIFGVEAVRKNPMITAHIFEIFRDQRGDRHARRSDGLVENVCRQAQSRTFFAGHKNGSLLLRGA